MKRLNLPRKTAALLVLLAVSGLARAEEDVPSAGQILPEDTILAIRLGEWSRWAQDWDKTSLAKICAEPEIQAFMAGPLARWRDLTKDPANPAQPAPAGGGAAGIVANVLNTLQAFVPGPVTLAVCRGGEPAAGAPPKPPALAVIMRSTSVGQWVKVVQILQDQLPFKVLQKEDYQGALILVAPTEQYSFSITEYGKHLVFTTDRELCKQIVDGIGGILPKKLADNPRFQASGLTGAEPMGAFLNVAALREMLGAQPGADAGRIRETLDFLGLEDLHSIAWSMRLDGQAFASRAAFLTKDKRGGLLAALDNEPLGPEALKICPPHTPFIVGLKAKPEYLSRLLRGGMGAGSAASERMRKVFEQAKADGRDLGKELAEAFGNELIVTSYKDPGSPTLGASSSLVFSLSVKDPAKAEELLAQVLERAVKVHNAEGAGQVALQSVDVEGKKVRYIRGVQSGSGTEPKYVLTAERLIVAMDMLVLKSALKNLKEDGLLQMAHYKEAVKGTDGRLGSMFVYVDWAQWYSSAFNLGATALKLIAPEALLKEVGVDLNLLPAPDAVTRHLFPAMAVIEATEQGVVMTSRSPLPSLEVVAPPVAAFSAVLATFGAQLGGEEKPAERQK